MPSDFTIEGRLKINDADLKRLPADVRRQTAKVQGTKAEIRTELNDTKAQADIMSLRRKVQYLSATGAYPKVALINGAKVNTDVIHIRNRMAHLSSTVARPKVVLSGDEKAIANIRGIRRELQKAGQGTVVPITTFPRVGVVSSPGAGAARGSATTAAAGAGGMLAGRGAGMLGGVGGMVASMGVFGGIRALRGTYGPTVGVAGEQQKLERSLDLSFGAEGKQFEAEAERLQKVTGFLAADFERAALMGWSLTANYDMQTKQIQKLLPVAADLAATSPFKDIQTTSDAFQRLEGALRGEAESSERLGLTLNDTYMKTIAFDGSLKDTWETMAQAEKAQWRYKEIFNQTQGVQGAAEKQITEGDYAGEMRQLRTVWMNLGLELGRELIPAATGAAKALRELGEAIPDWVPGAVGTGFEQIPRYAKYEASTNPLTGPVAAPYLLFKQMKSWWNPEPLAVGAAIPRSGDPWETGRELRIILEDETSSGVRATDGGSYTSANR